MSNFSCRVCGHDQWQYNDQYGWCTKCTTIFLKAHQFGNKGYIEDERQAEITQMFRNLKPNEELKHGTRLHSYFFRHDRWQALV